MKKISGPGELVSFLDQLGFNNSDNVIVKLKHDNTIATITAFDIEKSEVAVEYGTVKSDPFGFDIAGYVIVVGVDNEMSKFATVFYDAEYDAQPLDILVVDWEKQTWESTICDDEDCCPRQGNKIKKLSEYEATSSLSFDTPQDEMQVELNKVLQELFDSI